MDEQREIDAKRRERRHTGFKPKYTAEQRAEMRELYRGGDLTMQEIADRMGCSVGYVHLVVSGGKKVKDENA